MNIQILDKTYLVIEAVGDTSGGLEQYICRQDGDANGREYRAVRVPAGQVTAELICYLMEQVRRESFHEFVTYTTEYDFVTVLMDCGKGRTLLEELSGPGLSLRERLELARGLVSHLVLADFPPYFIHAAMDIRRIRVSAAMDFSFAFELQDILSFASVDASMAFMQLGTVLAALFEKEQKQRSFPDMERLIYRLRHGEFETLLAVYENLEQIYQEWSEKDEDTLENRSLAFVLWEKIKGIGRWLRTMVKAGILLLALGYLILSVYQFVQPEPVGQAYEKIGNLEIRE